MCNADRRESLEDNPSLDAIVRMATQNTHLLVAAASIDAELQDKAVALRQSQGLKTTEALAAWWQAQAGQNLAAALWATLTHPRCSAALACQVLGYVHMVQHQVGASMRVDRQHLDALMHENAVLARALAKAQERNTEQGQINARKVEALNIELVRLRAELIGRDTLVAALEEMRAQTEAAVPQLKSRLELSRQLDMQIERNHQMERALMQARQDAERMQNKVQEMMAAQAREASKADEVNFDDMPLEVLSSPGQRLEDCTVLCVGGRASAVPVYRQLVEKMGGRFLHHDGGEEESVARLDSTLAAADLVICQTGCISHNAYWRVKSHCKRTGKECVYVDNPSTHSLFKGLTQVRMHWHKA